MVCSECCARAGIGGFGMSVHGSCGRVLGAVEVVDNRADVCCELGGVDGPVDKFGVGVAEGFDGADGFGRVHCSGRVGAKRVKCCGLKLAFVTMEQCHYPM